MAKTHEAQARAIREKTARLKALRLAKEAEPQIETAPASQRPARRKKITAPRTFRLGSNAYA